MIEKLNYFGKNRIPFLFIIDFDKINPLVIPISEINNGEILFNIKGFKNYDFNQKLDKDIILKKYPMSFDNYKIAFDKVNKEFYKGNTFLLNLTFPTKIELNLNLREIFFHSVAKYKLFFYDKFVVFSPECFINIKDDKIYSYPMKGTIDATIPDAENIILNDEKEFAEHITIVDLIRNDLGIVSQNVRVEKFRYIDKIVTHNKALLQVSSEIIGDLQANWNENIGDIIYSLLPAGSISGAPKKKTVEIIKEAENYDRGYYTGIFGFFDGKSLDSAVMIRFIEQIDKNFYFKSGGGITIYSDVQKEYLELIEKVYVPIIRDNQN
ncbi:MAG: aminodeoxychorismate synthase component I [Spirochaetes bacterium GWD1_27_9]|nr:MAG: aminodeoxychorismate synthase component I [Spirochaetes bacterium GWB1_27_13]OHD25385.1 MAG: aminodeoxychorismate synthase component I [Spirochaetes bacterium GWC1_27_15]OHD30306.1 MAG: aminodeoxychorismate synthase component I [Spirochaetes bacterium GWD1_27_9]